MLRRVLLALVAGAAALSAPKARPQIKVAPAVAAAAAASTPPRSPVADLKRATTVERSPLVEKRAMADDDDDDDEAEEGEEARQRNGHNRI